MSKPTIDFCRRKEVVLRIDERQLRLLGSAVIDHGTTLRNVVESHGYLPSGFKDAEDFSQAVSDLFRQIQAQYSKDT